MSQIKHKKRKVEDLQKLPIIGVEPKNEKEEKYLREVCEYEFINSEDAGLSHSFTYGYSNDPHTFTFFHGGRYKLPRFIAMHVESKGKPDYKYLPDGSGVFQKQKVSETPRFRMKQIFGE